MVPKGKWRKKWYNRLLNVINKVDGEYAVGEVVVEMGLIFFLDGIDFFIEMGLIFFYWDGIDFCWDGIDFFYWDGIDVLWSVLARSSHRL